MVGGRRKIVYRAQPRGPNNLAHEEGDFIDRRPARAPRLPCKHWKVDMSTRPAAFKLSVPPAHIADLRERLARTRFPDQAPGPDWAYGTDVAWMQKLVGYWRDAFDWR